jgi:hypothetical protein
MFVELTADLIATIVGAFCDRRDIVPKRKDFKKVFSTIVQDDDVEKFYFCEATCVGSGEPCMRQVSDEESYCHFHDPASKCKGTTIKGENCRSVAKIGEDYCKRHQEDDEDYEPEDEQEITKKSKKNKYKRHSHSDDLSDDEVAHKKSKKNRRQERDDDEIVAHKKCKKNKKHEREDCEIVAHKKSKTNFFPLRDRD